MNLRHLERLRWTRTWRLPVVLGVHVLVGLGAPLLVRYEQRLLELQPGITVNRPPPGAIEGMAGFIDTWTQTGLLAILVAATTALCIDQYPGMSALLRETTPIRAVLAWRFLMAAGFSVIACTLAWAAGLYEVQVLFGGLPAARAFASLVLGLVFVIFVVALAAVGAAFSRGRVGAVVTSLAGLVGVSIVGSLGGLAAWSPGALLADQADVLAHGLGPNQLKSIAMTLGATAVLVLLAISTNRRREVRYGGEET